MPRVTAVNGKKEPDHATTVWLAPGRAVEWMKDGGDGAMAMLLASEPPATEAYRVSRAVNTPRNNTETLLQPV